MKKLKNPIKNHFLLGLLLLLTFMSFNIDVYTQCFPDRHNTSLDAGWLSCGRSVNPNPNRARGYWIMYELEERQTVSSIKVWNINHPDYLSSGVKKLEIDYIDASGSWMTHSLHNIDQAEASGFYEGEDLELPGEFVTDRILINFTENFGGSCRGLAEVKIGLINKTTSSFDIAEDHFDILISPNPFVDHTDVSVHGLRESHITYEVTNNIGQAVMSSQVNTNNETATFELSRENLPSGTYFLKIIEGNRVSSRKLSITSK